MHIIDLPVPPLLPPIQTIRPGSALLLLLSASIVTSVTLPQPAVAADPRRPRDCLGGRDGAAARMRRHRGAAAPRPAVAQISSESGRGTNAERRDNASETGSVAPAALPPAGASRRLGCGAAVTVVAVAEAPGACAARRFAPLAPARGETPRTRRTYPCRVARVTPRPCAVSHSAMRCHEYPLARMA